MNRYTAEFRGGDNDDDPTEWCVVDENIGPVGCAIIFNLTEEKAIELAQEMNEKEQ